MVSTKSGIRSDYREDWRRNKTLEVKVGIGISNLDVSYTINQGMSHGPSGTNNVQPGSDSGILDGHFSNGHVRGAFATHKQAGQVKNNGPVV